MRGWSKVGDWWHLRASFTHFKSVNIGINEQEQEKASKNTILRADVNLRATLGIILTGWCVFLVMIFAARANLTIITFIIAGNKTASG